MLQWLRFKTLSWGEAWIRSPFSVLLAPVSWIVQGIVWLRNRFYDRGLFRVYRVDVPVVSVGNLAVGGTGKTPVTALIAEIFSSKRVAILARGYGAKRGEWNDEMQLLQRHLPRARFYQGADRVSLANQAVAEGSELIVLDDGFQHRRLHRDFDLLLIRPEDRWDRILPWGRLREPWKERRRAHLTLSYDDDEAAVRLQLVPTAIWDQTGRRVPSIQGWRVILFSGIGSPERFRRTVLSLGAEIAAEKILFDHEPLNDPESLFNQFNVNALICTEKDIVKLRPCRCPVIWVQVKVEIAAGGDRWNELVEKVALRTS
jgi:tetraacyldisaccharide 4'-kinase